MEGSHIKERATEDKLQQKFKALQEEWESYKQSSPRTHRRYYSTDSNAMANKALQQLDCSPSNLVSSLHHSSLSPSEGGKKIRTNVLAIEEILRERMAVIESEWLKGPRRLFEALEDVTEMGFGIESRGNKDLPVCFHSSSSSSSVSSLSGEKVGGEVLEARKKRRRWRQVWKRREWLMVEVVIYRRRWMVSLTGWLIIASIFVYAIFCIVPVRSFGGYGDEHEMLLVPT
ncbi:hypothetical protein FH972_018773 [Carpinus fangiana]|uniref:Uncharacterized protein n=1 Tax=Carpinus fangiana TaxID=176857 RepID=A0A5N6RR63_9ROSI|nr:hypothetical protein FH972_018773 [Carpinus fangiana]